MTDPAWWSGHYPRSPPPPPPVYVIVASIFVLLYV